MFRLLKENSPVSLGLAAALNFLLLVALLVQNLFAEDSPLNGWLYGAVVVLYFLLSFLFTELLSKHRLLPYRTYLPFSIFFLCGAPFLSDPESWKYILTGILLLYAVDRSLSLAEESHVNRLILNGAIAIGLASYFVPGAIASIAILPIGLLNFQHFSFRHALMILSGVFIPWFFIWEIHFLAELSTEHFFQLPQTSFAFEPSSIIGLIVLAILWLLSFPHLFRSLHRTKLKTRQSVFLVVWASTFSCVASILISGFSLVQIALLVPALITFLSYRLVESKKMWHADVIVLLCLIVSVYNLLFLN